VLGAAGSFGAAAPAVIHAARIAPVPAISGHVSAETLSFPPTTADCLRLFHLHCYQPAQFLAAYHLNSLHEDGIDGAGRTIVIVDAFGSPTIEKDLKFFDSTFGLPDPPSLKIYEPVGAVPTFDPTNGDMVGWAEETTLDVEWTHVMAPGAKIVLLETPVSETEGITGFPEIVAAENWAIDHGIGDVISQSFGATEPTFTSPSQILGLRSAFKNAAEEKVTVLAASGDAGATDLLGDTSCCYDHRVNSWPSSDPLVTSVGGTMLNLDAKGKRLGPDVVWKDGFGAGGGGLSSVFSRPEFQDSVEGIVGSHRGTPDISMSAAVDGSVVYYWSFVPSRVGFHIVGGTSEASPLFAGIVAMADQVAGHRLGNINATLYRMGRHASHNGIVDVTRGNNSFTFVDALNNTVTVTGFAAAEGYDLASGWGTINAAKFVPALARAGGDSGD
jgi:subtilase family serine protease